MAFFTLTILCSLLSSGYLQDTDNSDYHLNDPNVDKSIGGDWPQQSYHTDQSNLYGQEHKSINPQPCLRRSNSESEPIKQHLLSPTYTSKIDTVVTNDNTATLKPHSLRNGDYNLKTPKIQELLLYPQIKHIDNNIYKTRNSLTVSNPVIDSFEEIHHEIIPEINNEVRDNILKPQPYSAHSIDLPPSSHTPSEVYSAPSRDFLFAPTSQFHFMPSSEYGSVPDSPYLSVPSHVTGPEYHAVHSTVNNEIDGIPSTNFISEPTNDLHDEPTHVLPLELANNLHSEPNIQEPLSKVNGVPSTVSNKCTHEETDNLEGHSRRSMSSYNDDDTVKDNLNSDNDLVHHNNAQYIESRVDNENAMASVLNVNPNTLKSSPDQNIRNYGKSKLVPHEKTVLRVRPQFNESRRELIEPTRGNGVTSMGQSSLVLMQTERICYACSTANNPSCWAPDRRTTVKYCRKGNNACITKTFGSGSSFTLIRDCGRSCDDSEIGGLMPKYKSCSMCHTELCNGAYSINGYSIILAILLIPLMKYLN